MYSDRSRASIPCARKRLLAYHIHGHGIERNTVDVRRTAGKFIHRGCELLLKGDDVETAAHIAKGEFMHEARTRGLQLSSTEDAYSVARECECLVESAIRGFAIQRLPVLQQEYRIVSVEDEGSYALCPDVEWMFRFDAVMFDYSEDRPVLLSIKTCDRFDDDQLVKDVHSMQVISDSAALAATTTGGVVPSIHFEYIEVGQRRKDKTGTKHFSSPLTRGYFHPIGARVAARREYVDRLGRTHSIGSGWETFYLHDSREFTPKEWVRFLDQNSVLADIYHPIEVNPPADEDIQDWREQVTSRESDIAANVTLLEDAQWSRQEINELFPQERTVCDLPYVCEFQDICYGALPWQKALEHGVYIRRIPNHRTELVQIGGVDAAMGREGDGKGRQGHTEKRDDERRRSALGGPLAATPSATQ